jgi:hypothetical protein
MRLYLFAIVLAGLVAAPDVVSAQSPRGRGDTIAARAVSGVMRGNVIAVRSAADRPIFDFAVTGASISGKQVVLEGTLRAPGGRGAASSALSASLVGSLAAEPSPAYVRARARRTAAQRGGRPPAAGAPAEQQPGGAATTPEASGQIGQLAQSTQSTARTTDTPVAPDAKEPKDNGTATSAAVSGPTGCDVVFVRMAVPAAYTGRAGSRTLQVGVTLAVVDNAVGIEINRRLCRIAEAAASGDTNLGAEVDALNRILSGAK